MIYLILAALAFLSGAGFERYRQCRADRPLSPRQAWDAWSAAVRRSVGWPAALLVGAALGGAVAVSLADVGQPTRQGPLASRGPGSAPRSGPDSLPTVEIRHGRLGRETRINGAAFRATFAFDDPWATQIRRRPAGGGRRWLNIGVRARNLRRSRFDPMGLAFRLRDDHGGSYMSDFQGGTAPRSLSRRGFLKRGKSALVQLSFRIPAGRRRFTLVFEDQRLGSTQVRLQLGALHRVR
jgi:hypothetical protein